MKVTILDTETGKTYEDEFTFGPFDAHWWQRGNGSCDCNRKLACGFEMDDSGTCDGCHRFLIIATNDDTFTLYELNESYPKELLMKYNIPLPLSSVKGKN